MEISCLESEVVSMERVGEFRGRISKHTKKPKLRTFIEDDGFTFGVKIFHTTEKQTRDIEIYFTMAPLFRDKRGTMGTISQILSTLQPFVSYVEAPHLHDESQ